VGVVVYALTRAHDRIRQARTADFPAIAAWRAAHFARMAGRRGHDEPVIEQASLSTAAWAVYTTDEDEAIAAIGFRDDPERRIRWGTDIFTAPSPAGLRAGLALGRMLEAMSDADGYTIYGETDPQNAEYIDHLTRRGYEITLVQFRRPRPK
jgi:hypothetical protein